MIKKYWWITIIGILLLIWVAYLVKPVEKSTEKTIGQIPINIAREDLLLPIELPKVKNVKWSTPNNFVLPTVNKYKIQRTEISTVQEKNIKKYLGINDKNGYVDKENNLVGYTEEIKGLDQLPTKGSWNIEDLKNKLKIIVEKVNGKENFETQWTSVKYKKILYPRWVDSEIIDSMAVEIRGEYILNGLKTTTFFGESIVGTFNKEGRLMKLSLSLLPQFIYNGLNSDIIDINVASTSPINMYGVVSNAGVENIENVEINQAEIVQVYSSKMNIIKPYYLLDGLTDFKIKVKLLLKAEK